tara:strand:+ start:1259 stop:1729 length:471 start_codon:yes stop_codon:yes gene_type:complete
MIETSENFIAIQALRKEYARKLLMLELHMANKKNDNTAVECDVKEGIREYCMSTPNRRNFIMHCCLATLNNKCISVSDTQKLLGMTDPGMRDMIKECVEKKRILLEKNKAGHRRVKATEITLETWMDYADYMNIMVDKFDFVHINASRRAMELLIK